MNKISRPTKWMRSTRTFTLPSGLRGRLPRYLIILRYGLGTSLSLLSCRTRWRLWRERIVYTLPPQMGPDQGEREWTVRGKVCYNRTITYYKYGQSADNPLFLSTAIEQPTLQRRRVLADVNVSRVAGVALFCCLFEHCASLVCLYIPPWFFLLQEELSEWRDLIRLGANPISSMSITYWSMQSQDSKLGMV